MSYHVSVAGGFKIDPPLDDSGRALLEAANRGWRASKDGSQLVLPEDEHPDPFAGLEFLVSEVLPSTGCVASGEARWTGEDGAEGTIRVDGRRVLVEEAEPQELSPSEVNRLLAQVGSSEEPMRLEAIDAIMCLDVSSRAAVAALARALRDQSLQVRMKAAEALGSFGAASLDAVPHLIAALDDAEPWMQAASAEALGAIGPAAEAALPALNQLTKHPSYGPAGRATEAIARIRGDS